VKHLVLVELGPELRVAKVLAWCVVVWHLLWVLGFPLVAQAALVQLGPTFLLVGQAAHLLQDAQACGKVELMCTDFVLRGLFLQCGLPFFLYSEGWRHTISSCPEGLLRGRSGEGADFQARKWLSRVARVS